ncbi:hypothetical protein FOCC_FOCC013619 [Frankliniella occidentalis]|nr:hypothetical protein FOCC_FOCC013619 [Frankliniella occidentalis]
MAAALKVYRFSLSWPRILPNVTASKPNPKGVQFYHDVIDEVLRYNMTPMVTVYQFDHPQVLEDQFKGWWSPNMIPIFKEYARFVFNEYGGKASTRANISSRVRYWTTVNEPNIQCTYFAQAGVISGLYTEDEVSNHFQCQRNLLLGHAEAYHVFKEDKHEGKYFNGVLQRMVGLTILNLPATPNSTNPEDVYAAEAVNSLYAGTIYHPVVFGDYSQMDDLASLTERLENFTAVLLPVVNLNGSWSAMLQYDVFIEMSSDCGCSCNADRPDVHVLGEGVSDDRNRSVTLGGTRERTNEISR